MVISLEKFWCTSKKSTLYTYIMVTWFSVWKCSSHIVLRLFISSQCRVACLSFLIDSCPRLQVNKDASIFPAIDRSSFPHTMVSSVLPPLSPSHSGKGGGTALFDVWLLMKTLPVQVSLATRHIHCQNTHACAKEKTVRAEEISVRSDDGGSLQSTTALLHILCLRTGIIWCRCECTQ